MPRRPDGGSSLSRLGPRAPRRRTPSTRRPDRHGRSGTGRPRGSGCRRPTSPVSGSGSSQPPREAAQSPAPPAKARTTAAFLRAGPRTSIIAPSRTVPAQTGPLDALGERERGGHHDQDRRERAVEAAPGRGARRQSRPGSQIRARRDGCERVLHGFASRARARRAGCENQRPHDNGFSHACHDGCPRPRRRVGAGGRQSEEPCPGEDVRLLTMVLRHDPPGTPEPCCRSHRCARRPERSALRSTTGAPGRRYCPVPFQVPEKKHFPRSLGALDRFLL